MTQLLEISDLKDTAIRKRSEVDDIMSVSFDEKTWFFFALTGINITGKLINSLRAGEFDDLILDLELPEGMTVTNLLNFYYFKIFKEFNRYWKLERPGIMGFNPMFDRIYNEFKQLLKKK